MIPIDIDTVIYSANTGIKKLPIPYTPVDLRLAPHWIGMDDILQHRFKLWFRTVINPEYYRIQCPEQVDRKDGKTVFTAKRKLNFFGRSAFDFS